MGEPRYVLHFIPNNVYRIKGSAFYTLLQYLSNNIYKKIESKLSDGDLRGVKHPKPQEKTIKPNIIIDGLSSCSSVTSNEVYNAIMSSSSGSAGGLDSLKSQHLKDLISDKLGLSSSNLLSSLAKIIDLMFRGLIPFEISQILYGDSKTSHCYPIFGNTIPARREQLAELIL
jgi:hypothetical protein